MRDANKERSEKKDEGLARTNLVDTTCMYVSIIYMHIYGMYVCGMYVVCGMHRRGSF